MSEPEGFTDRLGRAMHLDPSGRFRYRAFVDGVWTKVVSSGPDAASTYDPLGTDGIDGPTAAAPAPIPAPVAAPPATRQQTVPRRSESRPLSSSERAERETLTVETAGSSWVSGAILVLGGLALVLSVVGTAIGIAAESRAGETADYGTMLLVGVAGVVQSLLLIAFGQLLVFTRATAVLLARNLDDSR